MKLALSANPRNNILLVGAIAILLAYGGDNQLRTVLASHYRVIGGTPTLAASQVDNLKQLYPLLVNAQGRATPAPVPAPGEPKPAASMDQLFGRVDLEAAKKEKEKKPAATDYFAALKERQSSLLRLDGVAPSRGAFINSTYVAIGEPVDSVSYPADPSQNKMVAPTLVAATDKTATLQEPHGRRTIILKMDN
ncbi:hypothetical protein [Trinickia mobilis]|uniref:hypothetical protein n=1 Tax=Trinickia mobilis TaxID=2816356 RepID=UPI001A9062D9|nr:hypothetical protein [Trinickia mobilis]